MIEGILVALAVVGAVALVLGILLAVMSYFFGIEEDDRVRLIRECLPGINCGACGYKGCDDYASALAAGEAAPNLCVPGASSVTEEIGEILGIKVEAPKGLVAFVHCNGVLEATGKKACYEGIVSCSAESLVYGGPNECRFGCLGCGDCASACPAGAICVNDVIAHIDTTRCLGCGLCMSLCPKKMITMIPQNAAVVVMCNSKESGAAARKACKNACIACKKCQKACPHGAMNIIRDIAVIDYEKCTGCGACADVCPTGCLKKVSFANREA